MSALIDVGGIPIAREILQDAGLTHLASSPVITIFVRHAADCKYAGDEFCKRCDCKKHFRWSVKGTQHRRAAGTRIWAEADRKRRILEDQLAGRRARPEDAQSTQTIRDAVEAFLASRRVKRVSAPAVRKYEVELGRFADFCEKRNMFTFAGLTLPVIVKYQATWPEFYESTYTQRFVGIRLRGFLLWSKEAGFIEKVPRIHLAEISEPPTLPLTDAEYKHLLRVIEQCDCGAHAHNPAAGCGYYPGALRHDGMKRRIRAIIQLMRWSGLAVRDASTLKRDHLAHNGDTYRIVTARQKTGSDVYVPIPPFIADEILAASIGTGNAKHLFWNPSDCQASSFAAKTSQAISNVFKHAGIVSEGHMVSHRLRDTFAVDLLQKGVPLEDVSKMLGHKNVKTTEDHYAQWVKGRQDRLDKIVSATWEKK